MCLSLMLSPTLFLSHSFFLSLSLSLSLCLSLMLSPTLLLSLLHCFSVSLSLSFPFSLILLGKEFIDAQAILRSCGLGLFDLRLTSLISLYQDRCYLHTLFLDYDILHFIFMLHYIDGITLRYYSMQKSLYSH